MKSKIVNAITSSKSDIPIAALQAFMSVESGGRGFDSATGKILIQFEPVWFKRKVPYAPSGAWSVNKVERQSQEWLAFNNAFKINPNGAMEATSIGLPQILGLHWKRLGYVSVGAMWDDFKTGEEAQIAALIRFIESDKKLLAALTNKDWSAVASIYNGSGYLDQAKRLGIAPYDIQMAKAYDKFSGL